MDEYSEISNLLRNFMKDDCHGGSDSCRNIDEITCSDNQSIDDIVNKISYEIHDGEMMYMMLGDWHMTVISVNHFFCDETKDNSGENI